MRASTRASRRTSSSAARGRARPKPGPRSSTTSRRSITAGDATRSSGCFRRWSSRTELSGPPDQVSPLRGSHRSTRWNTRQRQRLKPPNDPCPPNRGRSRDTPVLHRRRHRHRVWHLEPAVRRGVASRTQLRRSSSSGPAPDSREMAHVRRSSSHRRKSRAVGQGDRTVQTAPPLTSSSSARSSLIAVRCQVRAPTARRPA